MSGKQQDDKGGKGEQQDEVKLSKEDLQAIKMLPDLAKGLANLQQGFKGVNETLTAIQKGSLSPSGKTAKEEKEEKDDEDADPDTMTGKELVGHITKRVGKIVEPALKKADEAQAATDMAELRKQVEAAASANKDFWDWKEEMGALVKQHPDLPPARLYKLARSEDPKKAAELDKKYAEKDKGESDVPFGGLTPTSGRSRNAKRMNASEAAEAAWNATMSAFNIH